ncbi:UNVERIFIED_CONTAM: hypothetical protein PYX00_003878 [Menopon gallinae]|uniref:Nose resistant-to-fluoxetine protein N-terminal domain-containing protein n=1 Tax=Menopon gallinae TaxID=328185 RepID=A0AAW2I2P2_9NEOP
MDASGRYTPQFFYGNNFWLGSMSLCRELSASHRETNVPSFRVQFSVARLLIKIGSISPKEVSEPRKSGTKHFFAIP